jgi:hypothetical protein
MTTITQALDKVREQLGKTVGNGECYSLASYYEHLISPSSTVALGGNGATAALYDKFKQLPLKEDGFNANAK